jgi:23S rRNA U2552 (ribose-2'-O)-methylase RlmE/FtsJ
MIPLQVDINPAHDVSTTTIKAKDNYDMLDYIGQVDDICQSLVRLHKSTRTNSEINDPFDVEKEDSMKIDFQDNFDIVSKFKFKTSRKISVILKRKPFKAKPVIEG